jgi:hypothetical protein
VLLYNKVLVGLKVKEQPVSIPAIKRINKI